MLSLLIFNSDYVTDYVNLSNRIKVIFMILTKNQSKSCLRYDLTNIISCDIIITLIEEIFIIIYRS